MFGIFFEDINFAADGGLYPERIKNRSFEFDQPLTGWHANLNITPKGELGRTQGELDIRTEHPLNKTNPHYLRIRAYEPGYGLSNSGYRGIGVESGAPSITSPRTCAAAAPRQSAPLSPTLAATKSAAGRSQDLMANGNITRL
jgi:hypothetical protein